MSRKRRMFDIDMPAGEAPAPDSFPAGASDRTRRGPMAAAISEAASSARDRQEAEARIRAENDALAHEHVRLKRLGLVLEAVPLDAIDAGKLVRDRAPGPDDQLDELVASIRSLGLSNPIRLERAGDRFELVQGWRRLNAYRALLRETGDAERWGAIPAAVTEPGDTLDDLYRRMVDENLVRKDISFAEMARLAIDYATDPHTDESDPDRAVALLFQSAGYQKRSYIRAFIRLLQAVGPDLRHPADIPRATGLALLQRIEGDAAVADAVRAALRAVPDRDAVAELAILRAHAGQGDPAPEAAKPRSKASPRGRSRTAFQFDRSGAPVKCVATSGRLELKFDRDFSTVDRATLERALARFLDDLE